MKAGRVISFTGRIGRASWWGGQLLVLVAYLAIAGVGTALLGIDIDDGTNDPLPVFLLALACAVLINVSFGVRRCHDRGKSGWWMLVGVIPLIGAIWMLVELGFMEGEPGPNRYGDEGGGAVFGG